MAELFFADLIREASYAPGAGPLALAGALPGHRRFADVVPPGATFHYAIAHASEPQQWETGEGLLGPAGELVRSPLASSESGAAVAFSAGLKTVVLTAAAAWYGAQQAAIDGKAALAGAAFEGAVSAPSLALGSALAVEHGGTGASSATAARDNLGLVIGADVAEFDPTIAALAAMEMSPGLVEQTGADSFAKRALGAESPDSVPTRADSDARYARLDGASFTGAVSAQSLSLTTDLAIADGGTGASTAAGARTNFGLGSAALQASAHFIAAAEKAAANGVASLDGGGKIPAGQLPALALTDVQVVASQAAMVALPAQEGDVAIRTDLARTFVHNGGSGGTAADWSELLSPGGGVTSVNGLSGAVTLAAWNIASSAAGDVGATDVQGAIAELATDKAALAGAAFTGPISTADSLSAGGNFIANGQVAVGGNTISGAYKLTVNAVDAGLRVNSGSASFAIPALHLVRGTISCVVTPSASGFEIGTFSAVDIIFKRAQIEKARVTATGLTVVGACDATDHRVAGVKVVGARATGWNAATGTASRTTFDTATVGTAQLAERLKALIDDLVGHGLIGS